MKELGMDYREKFTTYCNPVFLSCIMSVIILSILPVLQHSQNKLRVNNAFPCPVHRLPVDI